MFCHSGFIFGSFYQGMKIRKTSSLVTGAARALLVGMAILVGTSRLQAGEQVALDDPSVVEKQISLGGKFSVIITREEPSRPFSLSLNPNPDSGKPGEQSQSIPGSGTRVFRFFFDNGTSKQEFDSAWIFTVPSGTGPLFAFFGAILREDGLFYLFKEGPSLYLGVAKVDKEGKIQPGHHQSAKESQFSWITAAKFKDATGKVIDQFEVEDANRIKKNYQFDSEGVPQLVSKIRSSQHYEPQINLSSEKHYSLGLREITEITELPLPGSKKAASGEKSKASPPQGELKERVIYRFLLSHGTQGETELKQIIFPRISSSAQSSTAEVQLLDAILTGGRVAFVYISQNNPCIGVSELSASGNVSTRDFPLPQNGEPLTKATFKYRSSSVIKGESETADSTLILEYPGGVTKEYFIDPAGKPTEKTSH